MKNFLFLLLLFIISSNLLSQENSQIKLLKKEILDLFNKQDYENAIKNSYKLIEICKKDKNELETAFAFENLGIFFSDITDYKSSIKYYNKALIHIDSAKNPKNYYSVLLNIGTTLMESNNFIEAKYYLLKSKDFFKKNNIKSHLIASYTNLAITYQNLNQIDEAKINNLKAIKIAEENHLLDQYCGPLINMGDIFFDLKNYRLAFYYYSDAKFYFKKLKNKKGVFQADIGLSRVYIHLKKYNEALNLLKIANQYFKEINDLKDVIICYELLSEINYKKSNFEKAFEFKNLQLNYSKKLSFEEKFQSLSSIQMQNKIFQSEKDLKIQQKLIQKEKKISTLLYVITILLIILIVIVIKIFRKKQNVLKQINNDTNEFVINQKNEFEQKIQIKDSELESFALNIVHKTEFIEELKTELKKIKKSNPEDVNNRINTLLLKLNSTIKKDKDLNQFLKRVENVNKNFYHILSAKFPELTSKEQKLCALIKLNLSSKDISLLTNVSLGAVTMARYRLRSKINIEKDENLTEFLQKMSDF